MADMATRQAYGEYLVTLGEKNKNIVVLDADLSNATKTSIFAKKFPDRFINCGIAEGNMMSVAAGLAACGKIPFASSFAMFAAGRAFEPVRNSIGYPHLNVKICATHAGCTVGEDGATHQCNEDIALMRTIPGMVVICPADSAETRAALDAAIEYDGPVYIRLGRAAVPQIYGEKCEFTLGRGNILADGENVTIVATGVAVSRALDAAKALAESGVSARVIDMHTIKPIDAELLAASAEKTGAIVTVEEHSIVGGLGGAVCEAVAENHPVPVVRVGVPDIFGKSGKAFDLLDYYGINADNIVTAAKKAIALKK